MSTAAPTPKTSTIHPKHVAEKHQQQPVELIDVRTAIEFQEVHAEIARNVPLDTLDPHEIMQSRDESDEPVYIICRSGSRGSKACEKFIKAGYTNIVNIEGGTQAWEAANLPVVRGKKMMSLERQVRIAAGSIVFVSSVLALTVNVYFAGLAVFVGAGLVFAGITDTCGMGMLLARMPWNKVTGNSQTCSVK